MYNINTIGNATNLRKPTNTMERIKKMNLYLFTVQLNWFIFIEKNFISLTNK